MRKKVVTVRRTQSERREATRTRLIDATLYCLERYGFAETTVSLIVDKAKVSRGALLHHYNAKNDLIIDAARTLMFRVFKRLQTLILEMTKLPDRLEVLVEQIWDEFFKTGTHVVYVELNVASRRDKSLAALLRALAPDVEENIRIALDQQFIATGNSKATPHELFLLTRWLLRGMALDAHLLHDPKVIKRSIHTWCTVALNHLQPVP